MKKNQFILLVVICTLTACSTTRNSAPVIDRTPNAKLNDNVKAPSNVKATAGLTDGAGNYTVKKGDTLVRIALDYGQNYRDIVVWNNLANPDDIKVDQVLRVAPPEAGSGAAQPTGVASVSSIEVRSVTSSSVPATANKAGPRADKKPYSESALEELQKPDVSIVVTGVKDGKVIDKAVVPQAVTGITASEDVVSWMWPVDGKILAAFDGGKSKGIDISGKYGQQIVAAGAGKVMYAGSDIRGYGNLVIIKHTNNLLSAYAHNKAIMVKEGQSVNKGEIIAEMGNSDSDAVKLHFEIRQQGKPVDPSKFLPTAPTQK